MVCDRLQPIPCLGVGGSVESFRNEDTHRRPTVAFLRHGLRPAVIPGGHDFHTVPYWSEGNGGYVPYLPEEQLTFVTLEIRAGKSTTEALRGLARRTGLTEVNALVSMLLQTERFGTSLSDTLRVHADGMRVRRMQRAEELAGRAPLKMMFPTVLIFVATLMVTIGPGFMQITAFFRDR